MSKARKHIATFPLYGRHPFSLEVDTRNRIGTGYVYDAEDIERRRAFYEQYGHPFRLRWRNETCRAAIEHAEAQSS